VAQEAYHAYHALSERIQQEPEIPVAPLALVEHPLRSVQVRVQQIVLQALITTVLDRASTVLLERTQLRLLLQQ
jgi:hypothetical protein